MPKFFKSRAQRLALTGVVVLGLAGAGCGEAEVRAGSEAAGYLVTHSAETGKSGSSWLKPAAGGGSVAGGGCAATSCLP